MDTSTLSLGSTHDGRGSPLGTGRTPHGSTFRGTKCSYVSQTDGRTDRVTSYRRPSRLTGEVPGDTNTDTLRDVT